MLSNINDFLYIYSFLLFLISIIGIIFNFKNIFFILIFIELGFLSINLFLIFLYLKTNIFEIQILLIYILTLLALETALGLSLLIFFFKNFNKIIFFYY